MWIPFQGMREFLLVHEVVKVHDAKIQLGIGRNMLDRQGKKNKKSCLGLGVEVIMDLELSLCEDAVARRCKSEERERKRDQLEGSWRRDKTFKQVCSSARITLVINIIDKNKT